ncbi:MAG: hypothetical protein AAF609_13640 [Cyanobacteria bacterium P01_C01_bin.120]
MANSKREEQTEKALNNLEVFKQHEETENRDLSVEQHYQKESGEQVWRNYDLNISTEKDADKTIEKTLNAVSKKETDIAICEKVLKERGTDRNTTNELSKSVADNSPGAIDQSNQQEYGREVVDKAQERLKPQEHRQPRENTQHQTVGHDSSYMKSIEMMKERDR